MLCCIWAIVMIVMALLFSLSEKFGMRRGFRLGSRDYGRFGYGADSIVRDV